MKNIIQLNCAEIYGNVHTKPMRIFVNAASIVAITEEYDGATPFTTVYLAGGTTINVKESLEEISVLHEQFTDLERLINGKN